MKIGFCVDKVITGGADKIMLGVIDKLLALGKYEILLFTKHTIADSYFSDYFRKNNIEIIQLRFPEERPSDFFANIKWRFARKKWDTSNKAFIHDKLMKCDVLIDFKNGVCFDTVKNIKTALKILWIHTSATFARDVIAENCDITAYDKIVCISKEVRDDILRYGLAKPDKTFYLYNYNFMNFDYIAEKSKEHLPVKDRYFLSVSRLDEGKDISTLIAAYKNFISETNSDIKLYIIGEGPLEKQFKAEAGELLNDRILFLGNINEPYSYMRNAEAFILSSESEGFVLVLIEAMLSETLVISSDCPYSPKEILENGQCGILFEVKNYMELSAVMTKIYNKEIDRQAYIKKASASLHRFNKEDISKQFTALFSRL